MMFILRQPFQNRIIRCKTCSSIMQIFASGCLCLLLDFLLFFAPPLYFLWQFREISIMPSLVLYLTRKKRKLFSQLAFYCHLVAFIISLALLVYSSMTCFFIHSNILYLVRRSNIFVGLIPLNNSILSLILWFINGVGCLFALDQQLKATTWRVIGALKEIAILETGALIITAISLLFNGAYTWKFTQDLTVGMERALYGYGNIGSNDSDQKAALADKVAVDWIQFKYECCGVNGYKDWLKPTYQLAHVETNIKNTVACDIQNLTNDESDAPMEGNFSCYIPYSCCKWEREDCISSYLLLAPTKNLTLDQIYLEWLDDAEGMFSDEGCPSAVEPLYPPWIPIVAFGALMLFEIGAAILIQFVQTSVNCANKMKFVPKPIAPGWLIPFWGKSKGYLIDQGLKKYHPKYANKNDGDVIGYGANIVLDEQQPGVQPIQRAVQPIQPAILPE